jgi:hypothetical protein
MRKRTGKIWLYIASLGILLGCLVPQKTAYAAGVSVSSPSCTVGDTVSVSVSFSQTNIGAVRASFSYDPTVLKYTGGSNTNGGGGSGIIVLYAGGPGTSSLGTSIKFSALKVGTANVSVSTTEFYDIDTNPVGNVSSGGRVTVREAVVQTAKPTATGPSASPLGTGRFPVTVNGAALYLMQSLGNVPVPAGFTVTQIQYKTGNIQAAVRADGKITLVYLADNSGQNGGFYVMDTQAVSFYPYITLTAGSYTLLPPPPVIPASLQQVALTVSGQSITAWQQNATPGYYLVYAMSSKGEAGFYSYDAQEGTLQRYTASSDLIEANSAEQQTFFQKVRGNWQFLVSSGVLLALCVMLFVQLGRAKKKQSVIQNPSPKDTAQK